MSSLENNFILPSIFQWKGPVHSLFSGVKGLLLVPSSIPLVHFCSYMYMWLLPLSQKSYRKPPPSRQMCLVLSVPLFYSTRGRWGGHLPFSLFLKLTDCISSSNNTQICFWSIDQRIKYNVQFRKFKEHFEKNDLHKSCFQIQTVSHCLSN